VPQTLDQNEDISGGWADEDPEAESVGGDGLKGVAYSLFEESGGGLPLGLGFVGVLCPSFLRLFIFVLPVGLMLLDLLLSRPSSFMVLRKRDGD
jgi:hypothetical protein